MKMIGTVKTYNKSVMYQNGYDNVAVCFAYIPDFKNNKEKQDFEQGMKDAMEKNKNKQNRKRIHNVSDKTF